MSKLPDRDTTYKVIMANAARLNRESSESCNLPTDNCELPVHAELLLLKELCDSQIQIGKHLRNHHLVSLASELSASLEKQAGRAKQTAPLPSKTISKQRRKIDQMKQTINHLHDRLAGVQASKRNKASQIARLKAKLQHHGICDAQED